MTKSVLLINGPNLNMLGTRQPEIYGYTTLAAIEADCIKRGKSLGLAVRCHQSNREYEIIEWIQGATKSTDGIIINPAAFTHTSVAILDALSMFKGPIIELHISNPHKREPFRHHSFVTMAATALICGLGVKGYAVAIDAMAGLLEGEKSGTAALRGKS